MKGEMKMSEQIPVREVEPLAWKVEQERTIVRAECIVQALFRCDNCDYLEEQVFTLSCGEFAWFVQGSLHGDDCPKCHDTMKLWLPEEPVLVLKQMGHEKE